MTKKKTKNKVSAGAKKPKTAKKKAEKVLEMEMEMEGPGYDDIHLTYQELYDDIIDMAEQAIVLVFTIQDRANKLAHKLNKAYKD